MFKHNIVKNILQMNTTAYYYSKPRFKHNCLIYKIGYGLIDTILGEIYQL